MLTVSRYNKKLIQRSKALVTSLPVNTTKVILPLKQTNQIDFNKKRKRLIQQTLSQLLQPSHGHTIFEDIPNAKVTKRR